MRRYRLDAGAALAAVVAAREEKREGREEKRAEQAETQTRAMQECVAELRSLNAAQASARAAIDDIPNRVIARLEPHVIHLWEEPWSVVALQAAGTAMAAPRPPAGTRRRTSSGSARTPRRSCPAPRSCPCASSGARSASR